MNSEDFKLVKTTEKFNTTELEILAKNKKFFSTDRKYIDALLEIINGESNISIRVLDWFVSNYSKKKNTVYKIRINGKEDYFYVNNEYKNQLNSYSKWYFDPFCRKQKLIYSYKDKNNKNNISFYSSIGQLNFFQWAIRNKVIKYVQSHIKEIETDMKEVSKQTKAQKMAELKEAQNAKPADEEIINDRPDPLICSSDTINSITISPITKSSNSKSDSEKKHKRHQLSKSVYDHGIKKSVVPIRLDFD